MATRNKVNGRRTDLTPGGFAGIPRRVMEHPDFRGLSFSAKSLLLILAYQYRGKNNGDLMASHRLLRPWGFGSKVTVIKAINELLEANLIIRTREGRFQRPNSMCALYALTWQPIDECGGKLEVAATIKAPRKLSLE